MRGGKKWKEIHRMKIVRLTIFFQSSEDNLWNVAAFLFNSVHFISGLVAYSSKREKKLFHTDTSVIHLSENPHCCLSYLR